MAKRLVVTSPYPNIRGTYVENGTSESKAAFVREAPSGPGGADAAPTWIFFSAKFGQGPCWYFGGALPEGYCLSSFCSSAGDAGSPEEAEWPPEDIAAVVVTSLDEQGPASPMQIFSGHVAAMPARCPACDDLHALAPDLRCPSCADNEHATALAALCLLKAHVGDASRKRIAGALARGDGEAIRMLEDVAAASEAQDARPVVIMEPPAALQVGAGTVTLTCEAISFGAAPVQYQWFKDGTALRRAERPRFMFCGATSQDEGFYVCQVSAGGQTLSSQPCEVKLADSEAARRARFELPLKRAAEAEAQGSIESAVNLLGEAIGAAEDFEAIRAQAMCHQARLLLQLSRWEEAFNSSTAALTLSPGLASAHAARGKAATELGYLAEAVSSWETAELLGGVPEAVHEAEVCRQRLRAFFEEKAARRGSRMRRDAAEGAEDSWRQAGWQEGRHARGPSASFFRNSGGTGNAQPAVDPAFQRHLQTLGLTTDAMPSVEVVRGAYRRLALQAHPDKPGGSKAAFQELQAAYEAVLRAVEA